MLFKELVLDNYKIYYGRQVLNFELPDKQESPYRKNLILVGGLNGAGKTTILNAIYYVLFGRQGMTDEEFKNSFTSSINDRAYDEGTRDCSLQLTIKDSNETITIKVTWSFDQNKRLINENRTVNVQKEGKADNVETYSSTEEYLNFINRRIPFDVAPFFIFDGEKIQDLVAKQDQKMMKDSIQKIVSLDMYKSLVEDLGKIQANLESKLSKTKTEKKLSSYTTDIKESLEKIERYQEKLTIIEQTLENLEEERVNVEQDRRRKLAHNTKSSIKIEKRISEYETRLDRVNKDLLNFAKKGLKNHLLSPSITNLKKNLLEEKSYSEKKAQQEAMRKTKLASLESFLAKLFTQPIEPSLSEEQKKQIRLNGEKVWAEINKIPEITVKSRKILHDISPGDREKILNFIISNTYNVRQLLEEKSNLQRLITKEKLSLENAPDPMDTEEEDRCLTDLNSQIGKLHHKRKEFTFRRKKEMDNVQNLRNLAQRLDESQKENNELSRQYGYVYKLREAASHFVEEMTELKTTQIRYEFSSILEKLIRKGQDFEEVQFDEDDYVIRIYNDKGVEIQLNNRSAGEKQIIALSFIWALTKTAGLSLPFVIDTPLGRLDSIHRNHIIRNYFNALSDQVIILSTDTEVNKDYIDFISNYMIRGYELTYDEKTKSSSIKEGYFTFS